MKPGDENEHRTLKNEEKMNKYDETTRNEISTLQLTFYAFSRTFYCLFVHLIPHVRLTYVY